MYSAFFTHIGEHNWGEGMMRKPKVLLLGNGLMRAFDQQSWWDFMKSITVREDMPEKLNCPNPLQMILRTNDTVGEKMKSKQKEFRKMKLPDEMREMQKKLLTVGFDHILTTNYSYELEETAYPGIAQSDTRLRKITRCFRSEKVKQAERKYLLHTYNEVLCEGVENKIWHIHGEARKPDSMVIGHYYYGNLLRKYQEVLKEKKNLYEIRQKNGELEETNTWLDAFILGDIYVLGFGFDLSEFDLWWLLNRRKRERAKTGNIHFFLPDESGFQEKDELLKLFDVEIHNCGFSKEQLGNQYQPFYHAAIDEICKMVRAE